MNEVNPADVALTCDLDAEVEARIVEIFRKVMNEPKYETLRHYIAREIVSTPFFIDAVLRALNPPNYTYTAPNTNWPYTITCGPWNTTNDPSDPR